MRLGTALFGRKNTTVKSGANSSLKFRRAKSSPIPGRAPGRSSPLTIEVSGTLAGWFLKDSGANSRTVTGAEEPLPGPRRFGAGVPVAL